MSRYAYYVHPGDQKSVSVVSIMSRFRVTAQFGEKCTESHGNDIGMFKVKVPIFVPRVFAVQCIDGNYPEYLNDLSVINRWSNSRKLNILVQPKFKSKYGHNCIRYQGPRLWNGVDNEF